MKKSEQQQFHWSMKAFLDRNAIFLVNATLPREVRCFFCKASTADAYLYLNHNSIGESYIACQFCHTTYQEPRGKMAGA